MDPISRSRLPAFAKNSVVSAMRLASRFARRGDCTQFPSQGRAAALAAGSRWADPRPTAAPRPSAAESSRSSSSSSGGGVSREMPRPTQALWRNGNRAPLSHLLEKTAVPTMSRAKRQNHGSGCPPSRTTTKHTLAVMSKPTATIAPSPSELWPRPRMRGPPLDATEQGCVIALHSTRVISRASCSCDLGARLSIDVSKPLQGTTRCFPKSHSKLKGGDRFCSGCLPSASMQHVRSNSCSWRSDWPSPCSPYYYDMSPSFFRASDWYSCNYRPYSSSSSSTFSSPPTRSPFSCSSTQPSFSLAFDWARRRPVAAAPALLQAAVWVSDAAERADTAQQRRWKKKKSKKERITPTEEQTETKPSLPTVRLEDRRSTCEPPYTMARNLRRSIARTIGGWKSKKEFGVRNRHRLRRLLSEHAKTSPASSPFRDTEFVTPLTKLQHYSALPPTTQAARFSFPHRFHYEAYFGPPQTEEEKGHTTCRVSFNVKQLKLPHTLDSAILRPC
eukprot:GHVT01099816.1.p1 GENE.GHVT01099816.1~~GHVT01099816.1.p1  ORF type:complete len:503 (+),score=90.65 GHVT01099816.1:310-1818(+)